MLSKLVKAKTKTGGFKEDSTKYRLITENMYNDITSETAKSC